MKGLENDCVESFYYKRKGFFQSILWNRPYIVQSRKNQQLIQRLNRDQFPILIEGIHGTSILPFLDPTRRVVVRMHNEEVAYYQRLAMNEKNLIRKAYGYYESLLLRRYYDKIVKSLPIAAISSSDTEILRTRFQFTNVHHVPCFLPWQEISAPVGKGNYCLYHGNMKIAENAAAAAWLVKQVFSKIKVPFIIAGKGMPKYLSILIRPYHHIHVINNPSSEGLEALISGAHIHVLPSLNSTGIKLKLLHALFKGRFCITNQSGIEGSGITDGIFLAEESEDYIKIIPELFKQPFNELEIKKRLPLLLLYHNQENARLLSELL